MFPRTHCAFSINVLLFLFSIKLLTALNAKTFNCGWLYPTMDIRSETGVKVNKITGSRIEYIPFPMNHKIEPGHNFSFEFNTLSKEGLVFVTGNFKNSAIITAFLANGSLAFGRKCGRDSMIEPHSHSPLNDGTWHKMSFTLTSNGGKLVIDNKDILISKSHEESCGSFNSLVFGGLSKKIYDDNWETFDVLPSTTVDDYEAPEIVKHRFSGCIRNLSFDSSFPIIPPKYYGVSQCDKRKK